MAKFCTNCGNELGDTKFCAGCGAKQEVETIQTQSDSEPIQVKTFQEQPKVSGAPVKKKKGCMTIVAGFLVVVAVIVVISALIGAGANNATADEVAEAKAKAEIVSTMTLKEFDAKSWQQFGALYFSHNRLMGVMDSYANGTMSRLDFYNSCVSAEEYFMEVTFDFSYGVTEDEKTYLEVFRNWAMFDQMAAGALVDYLDSNSMEDLANAQANIKMASDSALVISGNRIDLLKGAGYTEEEITEIIAKSLAELENQ